MNVQQTMYRRSYPGVFLRKSVLKVCSKFTGEHPCRSAISIKLHSNFIVIELRCGCSSVNLLLIFRTPFLMNISVQLLLNVENTHIQNLVRSLIQRLNQLSVVACEIKWQILCTIYCSGYYVSVILLWKAFYSIFLITFLWIN